MDLPRLVRARRVLATRRVARIVAAVAVAGAVAGGCAGPGSPIAPTPSAAMPGASPSPARPPSPTPAGPRATTGGSDTGSTAPSATTTDDPVLLAVGDIGRCDATGDDEVGALLRSLPGDIATLGDTAYDSGTPEQLRDCFAAAWGDATDRIRYAITGNHDDRTDAGAPLRDYLGRAASRDGLTYFSDQLGAWHVVVLDANCGVVAGGCGRDSSQVRWLRDDLAASTARCTLALWHQPRFSSGYHGDDGDVGAFWDALHAAGADLVLNGHDHDYERFAPQDPSAAADDARGITEIVVGTGGGDLRDFGDPRPNSAARAANVYGVLELRLRPDGWDSRFVPTTPGSFSDEATGTCH